MLNFPIPYSNELIYSTIARAGAHHAIISPKQLLDEIFTNRKVIATIDLPNHLSSLLEHLPDSYTHEKLVYKHTLFPLYALFSPEKTRLRCLKWMENQSQGSIHLAFGVAASRVKQISTLRYCYQCLNDQYIQYGEYFWSRIWQVQGANCCSKHRTQLLELELDTNLIGRHQFIVASQENCLNKIIKPSDALDFIISCRIEELLTLPPTSAPTFHQWSQFYHRIARRLGFGKGAKHIDHIKINSAIIKIWDLNWLRQHHLDELHTETSWLKAIFRKHRKSFSYLEHIIVLEAFYPKGWTWETVLREIYQIPLNLPHSDTQIQRAEYNDISMLTIKRNEWVSLIQECGIKPSRIKNAALYAWLYRNDKTWLLSKNRKFHALPTPNRKKVNWSLRDWQLVKQLFKIFYELENDLNLPRQSKSWFLKQITQSSSIEKNLHQLPLTLKFLNTFSECVSSYQIRRITRSIIQCKLKNQFIARWKILRHAGLSEERLTTEALKFIDQIRRTNYA